MTHVEPSKETAERIRQAADLLRSGQVISLPAAADLAWAVEPPVFDDTAFQRDIALRWAMRESLAPPAPTAGLIIGDITS